MSSPIASLVNYERQNLATEYQSKFASCRNKMIGCAVAALLAMIAVNVVGASYLGTLNNVNVASGVCGFLGLLVTSTGVCSGLMISTLNTIAETYNGLSKEYNRRWGEICQQNRIAVDCEAQAYDLHHDPYNQYYNPSFQHAASDRQDGASISSFGFSDNNSEINE